MPVIDVPGLDYVPGYLSAADQEHLMHSIDQQPWLTDLKRRVQQYGYRYDYQTRLLSAEARIGELPPWLMSMAQRLHTDGWITTIPDQAIVNEYQPGQGIARHVDCVPCFGDTIISLTLGSACLMTFTHLQTNAQAQLLLEPGGLLVMRSESRYEWNHGMAARKTDIYNGTVIHRSRRISVTFRTVILI